MKVLLVRDGETAEHLLATLQARYTIVTASNWAQSYEACLNLDADVVLLNPASEGSSEQHLLELDLSRLDSWGMVDPARSEIDSPTVISASKVMRDVVARIDRVARHDVPMMVIGESGTGKELLARASHHARRAHARFVVVDCASASDIQLRESLRTAHLGTLFLDEIAEMPPPLQRCLVHLLRDLGPSPGETSPRGGLDVRIITSTRHDPTALVAERRVRQDLLYRINVVDVRVPPLRDRPDDLAPLVHYFLDTYGARLGRVGCRVSPDAMTVLGRFPWPGNVRELETVIQRALVLASSNVIEVGDLPDALTRRPALGDVTSSAQRLADIEREHITRTLRSVAGNKTAAARALGLDRKTLYRKIAQHRIGLTRLPHRVQAE